MDVISESANQLLAVWVHNLDPVLLPIWKNFQIRWYGLAYLTGFVMGYVLLRWLAKRELWVVKPEKVGDFIAYAALFGVFLGGRVGYVLFYMIPDPTKGLSAVLSDPLVVIRVWEGGMSSHGGILGLTIFAWVYARKTKVSWPGIGDGLVIASTLGVFFGRLANFVNGELYGRTTEGVAWAMKFPKALLHDAEAEQFDAAMQAAAGADPERLSQAWNAYVENPSAENARLHLLDRVQDAGRENGAVMETLGNYLQARHPSQLYQALLEGLGLCLILLLIRLRFRRLPHGVITGIFFLLYAAFRIVAEQFREPDSAWVIENVLTKGQFYSIFFFAIGAAFLWFAFRGKTGRLGDQPLKQ